MKKQMSLFVGAMALLGISPVWAATNTGMRAASSADLTSAPATRERANVNIEKYETRTTTRTYNVQDAGDLYYTQPARRSDLYKQYDNSNRATTVKTANVRKTRAETVRSELKRKYYLAHPFYQPLQGKFGSITDVSYTKNSYDMKFGDSPLTIFDKDTFNIAAPEDSALTLNGQSGKWKATQWAIKEDLSYGITDRIAIMGMLRYDSTDYKFQWSNGPDDKMDDNGLNMFGVGAQWRMVDNDEWIATASAYFEHQKDIANSYILDLKGGYKVARSTIYGVLRGWYVDFDGDAYGNGVSGQDANGNNATLFLAYNTDVNNTFYIEAGAGVFSVLDEDWTLNVEAIFGDYDWHNQATIKGAIGWQPNDWFALNLYVKTAFYDSANDKKLDMYFYRDNTVDASGYDYIGLSKFGKAQLDSYSETTVGLQAIFQF